MPYTRTTWVDYPNTTTPITATSLNNIETGLSAIHTTVDGFTGAWTSYTPTWTNLTVGNATQTAAYVKIGRLVVVRIELVWGSTTSASGQFIVSLPVTSRSYTASANFQLGDAMITDAGTGYRFAAPLWNSTTTVKFEYLAVSGSLIATTPVTNTAPMTWTSTDMLMTQFAYEAAA